MATSAAPAERRGPQSVVHLAWAAYKKQLVKRPLPTKVRYHLFNSMHVMHHDAHHQPAVLPPPPPFPPRGGGAGLLVPDAY